MSKFRAARFMAVLLVLALVAAACGDDDSDTAPSGDGEETDVEGGDDATGDDAAEGDDSADGDDAAEGDDGAEEEMGEPKAGGRVVIGVTDEAVGGFYPATSAVGAGGNAMAMAIFDTLTVHDADGLIYPYLAESFTPNEDSTEWIIKLRDGIQFADATPLDAAALKDNFDRMEAAGRPIDPGFTSEVVSEMELQVNFQAPYGAFPAAMSSPYAWIASPTAMAAMTEEEFDENPVGTGPYMIKEWVREDHLTLERNPNYWRAAEGLPYLDEIEFRVILEDSVRTAALEAGDVDAIMVGDAEVPKFREAGDSFNTHEIVQGVDAIVYNNTLPMFQDQRVRLGLSQAVDVEGLIAAVWDGVGDRAISPIPHNNPYFTDVDYPAYDPAAAQALIEEYEAETGTEVQFALSFFEGALPQEAAQLLQQNWADIGVEVELNPPYSASDFPAIMGTLEYEVSLYGVPGFIDPDVWLWIEFRSDAFLNLAGFQSPEIDAAQAIAHGSNDFDERVAAYADVAQILAEEVQWFFIRDSVSMIAARPEVHGLGDMPLPDGEVGISKQGQFFTPFIVEGLWLDE